MSDAHRFPYCWKRADLANVKKHGHSVFSTFACGGGSSFGYKMAGFDVIGCNEIDKEMIAFYKANHNPKFPFLAPIQEFKKREDLPPELFNLDILDGSPPCFPAGTPVRTVRGDVPIESVRVGEKVLCHDGRYGVTIKTMCREDCGPMVSLDFKYGREQVVATPEHPFMVRRRGSEYRGRSLVKNYAEPKWCSAGEVKRGDLVLEPFQVDREIPEMPQVNVYYGTRVGMFGRRAEVPVSSLGFAWVVGLYLAEGHLRGREPDGVRKGPTRREVIFSLNEGEVDGLRTKMEELGWPSHKSRNGKSVFRLSMSNLDLWAVLGWFGKGASNKVIPEWCHAMPVEWQARVLDSYFKGDGYEYANIRSGAVSVKADTVSRRLAFGIARMVSRVHGVVASVKKVAEPRKMLIQGRLVSCKETWNVGWRRGGFGRSRPGMVDDRGVWIPVRKVGITNPDSREVYNLSVMGQETYIAGGFAVHNCSNFSMAGSREEAWGKKKKFREGQQEQFLSDLFFEYLDLVDKLRPKVAVAENVKGMLIGNAKGYCKLICDRFAEIGYDVQLFLLNAATMGVPQARERVFFIARRRDLGMAPLKMEFREAPIRFKDVAASLPFQDLAGTGANMVDRAYWHRTRPGDAYSSVSGGSYFNWVRLSMDRVSPTVAATENMKHPDELRHLSWVEICLIGSYPYDYDFNGVVRSKRVYCIGMSVPPVMMAQIAAQIAEQCFGVPADQINEPWKSKS